MFTLNTITSLFYRILLLYEYCLYLEILLCSFYNWTYFHSPYLKIYLQLHYLMGVDHKYVKLFLLNKNK